MTCVRIALSSGPCSRCGAGIDGLHVAGEPPAVYGPCCCPGEHGATTMTPELRLAVEVAVDTLHALGLAPPKLQLTIQKALELCRAHADKLPEELRILIL